MERGWLVTLLLVGCTSPDDAPALAGLDTATDASGADSAPAQDSDESEPADTDTGVEPAPSCELGWGETEHDPLLPGEEAVVVRGPQGGFAWHVPGAVRCTGIAPGRSPLQSFVGEEGREPAVRWQFLDGDGAIVGGYPRRSEDPPLYRPMRLEDGPGLLNEYLVVWVESYELAIDRDVTMAFSLVDRNGVSVQASVPIRLVAFPGYEPPLP